MITITAEQIERVNLILSGVPGGIEKALSSTIRRANNTVRSETLKWASRPFMQSRGRTSGRKRQSRSAHSPATAELLEPSCLRATRYLYTASTYRRQFLSNGLPCRRRCLPETGARRFQDAFIARMQSGHTGMFERDGSKRLPISEFMGPSTAQMAGNSIVLADVEKRHKRSSTSALNTKSPAF